MRRTAIDKHDPERANKAIQAAGQRAIARWFPQLTRELYASANVTMNVNAKEEGAN
jgi:hypothetical protein